MGGRKGTIKEVCVKYRPMDCAEKLAPIRRVGWQRFLAVGAVTLGLPAMVILAGGTCAMALESQLNDDLHLDWDTTLSYAAGWRLKDQATGLISNPNADDGNRSFDKGDMWANRIKFVTEADLKYHNNFGIFARARGWYDAAYAGKNAFDSPLTHNNSSLYGGELTDTQKWTEEIEDRYQKTIEMLDLFAYSEMDAGGHKIVVRVGNQVVSWGESLFIGNSISTAQTPLDAKEGNVPGAELKDIFLPVGQVNASVGVSDNLTLAGYYQWEWKATRLDEGGTYFSTSDIIDHNGHFYLVAPGVPAAADRVADDDARDSGQYGFALRYLAEELASSEFGLYYLNYHEKVPMVDIQTGVGGSPSSGFPYGNPLLDLADMSSYKLAYAEDVKLYGFSVSTNLAGYNMAMEATYRTDYPIEVEDLRNLLGKTAYRDAEVLQVQASVINIFGSGPLWDSATLTAEVGGNQVYGIDGELRPGKDAFACGGTASLSFDYFQIYPGLDLKIPLSLKYNIQGNSVVLGTFTEYQDSYKVGASFTYKNKYILDLAFVDYFHDADQNMKADRDFISLTLKYTF